MDKTDIVGKLNTAVDHAVPDVKREILQRCKIEKDATVPMVFSKKQKHRNSSIMSIVAAAAVLLLALNIGLGFQKTQQDNKISATVDLDVNPSIELRINAENRVVEVQAINQDAKEILEGMDLTGAKTNVAVNAVVGAMLKNGYLNEDANSILVSVDTEDVQMSEQLQTELVSDIDSMLQACSVEAAILSQTVTQDPSVNEWADTYEISQGKAALIQKIITNNPKYCVEDLVYLTINELNLLLSSQLELMDSIQSTGTASEKSYIGQENALAIVMDIKGLTTDQVTGLELDIEVLNSRMVYGVRFMYEGLCYEYMIDALTGEVTVSEAKDPTEVTATTSPDMISENNVTNPIPTSSVSSNTTSANAVSNNVVSNNGVSGNSVSQNGTILVETDALEIAKADVSISANEIVRTEVSLETKASEKVYIVDVYTISNCYRYEISPYSGAIIKAEQLKLDSEGNAIISETEAKAIVLEHAKLSIDVAVFDKVELIQQDGAYVYKIAVSTKTSSYNYTIDAVNKNVLDYSKSDLSVPAEPLVQGN